MKIVTNFLAISLALNSSLALAQTDCSKVYSSLVFDEKTGNILSETRPDQISYPASLVKLMTLYLTFDALKNKKIFLEQELIISERGEEIAAVNKINTLKLKKGDEITVKEAIAAVVVKSFNEASVTLAEAVSGDEWNFTRLMNKTAKKLGMLNTSFRNASGLHEDGQYTTSYDLARLSRALIQDFPEYYHFFSLKKFTYNKKEYESHNYVLLDYKGAEGMKTGFTNAAGFNLISSAKRNQNRVVSIVMGCANQYKRDDLTEELLDHGFSKVSNPQFTVKLKNDFDYLVKQRSNEDDKMRLGMSDDM